MHLCPSNRHFDLYCVWQLAHRAPIDALGFLLKIDSEPCISPARKRLLPRGPHIRKHGAHGVSILGSLSHAIKGRRDNAHNQGQDGKNHHQFQQRETSYSPLGTRVSQFQKRQSG